MKKLLLPCLSLAFLFNSNVCQAQSAKALAFCKDFERAAEKIMTARQDGMAMSEMMEAASEMEEAYSDIAKTMVVEAYSKPLYRTEDFKRRAISEFANDSYLVCIKELRKSEK